jgi:hypothetical protein
MKRRDFLLLGAGAAMSLAMPRLASALPVPQSDEIIFRVMRKDSEIGIHTIKFSREGDRLTVDVAADIAVKFGPFTLFHYRHRATEIWQGDKVVSIDAETDDNGKTFKLAGQREGDGLAIAGASGDYIAPPEALPATHWNRKMLDHPMINTQNGLLMRPFVTRIGAESIPLGNGSAVKATRFSLSGDAQLDTWYDDSPAWAGLSFKAKDGSEVRYIKAG